MYHYAANNPVRYTDPDGRWVINNTDEYILIKTEDYGFVVLAPHESYGIDKNGNVWANVVDHGKIDGIILSKDVNEKTEIRKFSDKSILTKRNADIVLLILFCHKSFMAKATAVLLKKYIDSLFPDGIQINVTVYKENGEIAFDLDEGSSILNKVCDFVKTLKNKDLEKSGKYYVGNEEGVSSWIPRGFSQEELKKLSGGENVKYYSTADDLLDAL